MKSLILTSLYLAKDTVHRWFTRMSSPLARALVVFFLSICALGSLGSYVISTKIVRNQIIAQGANIVSAMISIPENSTFFIPSQADIEKTLHADSYVLSAVGSAGLASGNYVNIYTVDFSRIHYVQPYLSPSGGPTLLQDGITYNLPEGPTTVKLANSATATAHVRTLPEGHPLARILNGSALIVDEQYMENLHVGHGQGSTTLAIAIRDLQNSEPVRTAENYLRTLMRLEDNTGGIFSARPLLEQLDIMLDKQVLCRVASCVGISAIVGILLTALAGMEYRQNEYIYTLMKSFGIHPLLLVGSFIVENLIIVSASFAAACGLFMYFQRLIVSEVLKFPGQSISFEEIIPEIHLISYTLLGCILVSSLPIFAAANREIGRVLK